MLNFFYGLFHMNKTITAEHKLEFICTLNATWCVFSQEVSWGLSRKITAVSAATGMCGRLPLHEQINKTIY